MSNATADYRMNQTMLRIRDPEVSLKFYQDVLGMSLLDRYDFEAMEFSLYFLGYPDAEDGAVPADRLDRARWVFSRKALVELTHNWGTEKDDQFPGYHDGNAEPRGFGHIGITVPDVYEACERFERLGVSFVKRPDEGSMKGLAFIRDPDGYWIEVLSADGLGRVVAELANP